MRTLLALAIFVGSILTLNAPAADAGRKGKRITKPHYYHHSARPRFSRQAVECERAWHADPTGRFAGYPCWAREALSPQDGWSRR